MGKLGIKVGAAAVALFAGLTGASAESWIDFASDRVPPGYDSNLATRRLDAYPKVAPKIGEYLELANAPYSNGGAPPDGFRQVGELPSSLDDKLGLKFVIYQATEPGDDRTVISFRGTEKWNNWLQANIPQILYGAKLNQVYQTALEEVKGLMRSTKIYAGVSLSEDTILTGHSLGGGMAQYIANEINKENGAANGSGLRAITFNAAGIFEPSEPIDVGNGITSVGVFRTQYGGGGSVPSSEPKNANIVNVNVDGDIVSKIGAQLGQEYRIPSTEEPPVELVPLPGGGVAARRIVLKGSHGYVALRDGLARVQYSQSSRNILNLSLACSSSTGLSTLGSACSTNSRNRMKNNRRDTLPKDGRTH
jgi:Lipase (class 3)